METSFPSLTSPLISLSKNLIFKRGFPGSASSKESDCQCMRHRRCRLDPSVEKMKKEMATYSSILAGITPWTEEAGGLQSMESQRVGHNSATEYSY